MSDAEVADAIEPGRRVEVHNGFDASWARGFEIIERTEQGYRLRRLSDGTELPVLIPHQNVRPEKKLTNDMWWY